MCAMYRSTSLIERNAVSLASAVCEWMLHESQLMPDPS